MESTTEAKARAAFEQATEFVKPIVQRIEAGPELTMNRYGEYLTVLCQTPQAQRKLMAAVLIKAGANEKGVASALKLTM
jgi:hypothetical protein